MIRLLRIEWGKIQPYRAFRILIGLYLVSFIALPWSMETVPFFRNFQQLFEFPAIWFFYYFGGQFLSFALAIIVITITTNEYSNRTFRQHVVDGLSRNDLIVGKFLLMALMSALITVLFVINGYIAGRVNAFQLNPDDIWTKAGYIPGFFLHTVGIMSLSFFLANLFRRTGVAIFAFIAWVFPVELFLRAILKAGLHDNGLVSDRLPVCVFYHHNASINDLLNNPSAILDISSVIPNGLGMENMVMKSVWTLVFLGLSWWMIQKRDL